jgi:hypothetical protein
MSLNGKITFQTICCEFTCCISKDAAMDGRYVYTVQSPQIANNHTFHAVMQSCSHAVMQSFSDSVSHSVIAVAIIVDALVIKLLQKPIWHRDAFLLCKWDDEGIDKLAHGVVRQVGVAHGRGRRRAYVVHKLGKVGWGWGRRHCVLNVLNVLDVLKCLECLYKSNLMSWCIVYIYNWLGFTI